LIVIHEAANRWAQQRIKKAGPLQFSSTCPAVIRSLVITGSTPEALDCHFQAPFQNTTPAKSAAIIVPSKHFAASWGIIPHVRNLTESLYAYTHLHELIISTF